MSPLDFRRLRLTCVDCDATQFVSFLTNSYNRSPGSSQYHSELGHFTFADAYIDLPTNNRAPLKAIIWEPQNTPGRCAFMTNVDHGLVSFSERTSRSTDFEWVHISVSDSSMELNPAVVFRYYHGQARRFVGAGKFDSARWEFHAYGDILPFEDNRLYAQRRVSDRLKRTDVLNYLESVGYPVRSDDFWSPRSAFRLWQERM